MMGEPIIRLSACAKCHRTPCLHWVQQAVPEHTQYYNTWYLIVCFNARNHMPVLSRLSLNPTGRVEKCTPSQRLPSLYELQSLNSSEAALPLLLSSLAGKRARVVCYPRFLKGFTTPLEYFFVSKNGKI